MALFKDSWNDLSPAETKSVPFLFQKGIKEAVRDWREDAELQAPIYTPPCATEGAVLSWRDAAVKSLLFRRFHCLGCCLIIQRSPGCFLLSLASAESRSPALSQDASQALSHGDKRSQFYTARDKWPHFIETSQWCPSGLVQAQESLSVGLTNRFKTL